jgi:TPR repeat protein
MCHAGQAKWYLAICHLNGHEMAKDEQKASALFQEAALKGCYFLVFFLC